MKILLDTHYLIWSLTETKKINKKIRSIILDDKNDIFISIISLWEISLKYSIGKLEFQRVKIDDILPAIKKSGFNILKFEEEQAISFYKLPKIKNKDPFDRMIIWQSLKNEMNLLTKDKKIKDQCNDINLKIID